MGTRDEGPEEAPDLVYSSAHGLGWTTAQIMLFG